MRFKDLTDEQIEHAKKIYTDKSLKWDDRMEQLMTFFGKSERTVRRWCSKGLGFKERLDVESKQYQQAKKKTIDKTKKRYLISWAQNNTPIHESFLNNMKAYAKEINASIHIIAGRYKNPTSVFEEIGNEIWDDSIKEYLDANRHNIHKYLSILSDVKIQPTATNPMTGMQGMSGLNSCVFGSPKVQMEMIPVLEGNKPKMMLTTGAVSIMNYTDSKAGKQGEFHHTFGFCIVEIKDKDVFFIRQVTADDKTGNFSDLYYRVENGKVSNLKTIAAIVLGDLHYGHHDKDVLSSTMKFLDRIKPEHIILHDVFDGNAISHHDIRDPFIQYGKELDGSNDLKKEIDMMLTELKAFEKFKNVVIVRSNHDDFLDRWLKNEDWKKQPSPKNSRLYMQYSDMLLEQYAKDPNNIKGVIPALINKAYPKYITLSRSASYRVNNWELGQHGDIGSSGTRGSLLQFRRLNTKIVVGHYHAPGRKDGALSVGTSTKMRIGYNVGPSAWLQSHVIIHNDNRAQHLNFINGEYTTFK